MGLDSEPWLTGSSWQSRTGQRGGARSGRREKRFLRDIETGAVAISLGGEGVSRPETNGNGAAAVVGTTHIFSLSSSSVAAPSTAEHIEYRRPASPPSASTSAASGGSSASPTNFNDDSTGRTDRTEGAGGIEDPPTATTPSSSPSAWTLFNKPSASLAPPSLDHERELSLMMIYLDYVFPFLYPFCRPAVLSSGRG
ncbi:MAG: hypothetical protein STHCBS139747_006729 [Sporothrix thermara]